MLVQVTPDSFFSVSREISFLSSQATNYSWESIVYYLGKHLCMYSIYYM